MSTKMKSPPARYTIGRKGFAKISEVDGLKASRQMEEDFQDFDRKGLSPKVRRAAIARKYGRGA